jgi:hypothetical protein
MMLVSLLVGVITIISRSPAARNVPPQNGYRDSYNRYNRLDPDNRQSQYHRYIVPVVNLTTRILRL